MNGNDLAQNINVTFIFTIRLFNTYDTIFIESLFFETI